MKRAAIKWVPAISIMAAIFAFSSLPGPALPGIDGWADILLKKGGHVVGYGILAMAIYYAIGGGRRAAVVAAWGGAVLYGLSDEFHQSFIPGRNPSLADVAIDASGAWLGLWLRGKGLGHKAVPVSQTGR